MAAAPHHDPGLKVIAGFRKGLTTPSRLALGVLVATTLAWLALLPLTLTPGWLRTLDERALMSASYDEYGLLTARILKMQTRARSRDEVILLGTSVIVEGISSDADFADALERVTGRRHPVHNLSASAQSPLDYMLALDAVAPVPGVVVMSPVFVYPPAEYAKRIAAPRHGLRSPHVDDVLRSVGVTPRPLTGLFLYDNLPFLANHLLRLPLNVWGAPPAYAPHAHVGRPKATPQDITATLGKMLERYENLDENFKLNARIFEQLLVRVRAAGGDVVFLKSTVNPAWRGALQTPLVREYEARVAAFAAAHDVRVLDAQPDADVDAGDFHDAIHLDSLAAMARYTGALARSLAPVLAGRE